MPSEARDASTVEGRRAATGLSPGTPVRPFIQQCINLQQARLLFDLVRPAFQKGERCAAGKLEMNAFALCYSLRDEKISKCIIAISF